MNVPVTPFVSVLITAYDAAATIADAVRSALAEPETAEVIVVAPRMLARSEVFEHLGLRMDQNPMGRFISVDATGWTGVPGVWAAGNVADLSAQVGAAAAAGTMAAARLNAELVMERL